MQESTVKTLPLTCGKALAPHTMRSQVMGLRDASPSQQTDT